MKTEGDKEILYSKACISLATQNDLSQLLSPAHQAMLIASGPSPHFPRQDAEGIPAPWDDGVPIHVPIYDFGRGGREQSVHGTMRSAGQRILFYERKGTW